MEKQVEYEALRNEIIYSMQIIKNYRSLLYTIVIAVLAIAFQSDHAVMFLVPFLVIIPIYLLEMHQVDSTARIGAYILVFIEPETECQWETRLLKYERTYKKDNRNKESLINPYWCISFGCVLLSFMKLDYYNRNINFYIILAEQIFAFVLWVFVFMKNNVNSLEAKEKYRKEWNEIKKEECREHNK